MNGASATLGSVNQSGDFTVGQSHAGAVTNSATWSITGAHDIAKGVAGGTFTNEGTLARSGTGVSDVAVATTNSGHVSVNQGKLEFSSTVANTGTMTATGSVLELDKGGERRGRAGHRDRRHDGHHPGQGRRADRRLPRTGNLALHTPGTFAGHISDFKGSDLIDLVRTAATSESFSGGVLTVLDGSTTVANLHFNGSYSTSSFSLASDLHGGTLIKFV